MLWSKGPPYGERENRAWNQEREKGFSLGRNARGRREQGTAAFKKTQREYVQEQRKRKPHKKEKKEERAAKRKPLKEKEDSQERVVRGEENKKERVNCYHLWKR